MIEFTWKIIEINETLKSIIVEYTNISDERKLVYSLHMPPEGSDIKKYIESHAPNNVWNPVKYMILDKSSVGMSGTNATEKTIDYIKLQKINEIKMKRYNLEISGIFFNGYKINTNRESQALILSAFTTLKEGLVNAIDFKTMDGSFIQLNLELMNQLAKKVAEHVQNCFTLEKNFVSRVNAATTIEEIQQIVFS